MQDTDSEVIFLNVSGTDQFFSTHAEALCLTLPLRFKASELQREIYQKEFDAIQKKKENSKYKIKDSAVDFELQSRVFTNILILSDQDFGKTKMSIFNQHFDS